MALRSRKKPAPKPVPRLDIPEGFVLPAKTQWAYMPALLDTSFADGLAGKVLTGTIIGSQTTLHHDAEAAEIGLRKPIGAINALTLKIGEFAGSFVSLAMALPDYGVRDLSRNDLVRIALRSEAQTPFKAYARLNLRQGPNTEQMVRMIDIGTGDSFAEFDIFYSEFDPARATDAWIDLIFNDLEGLEFSLFDPVILRRVRASL